MAPIFGTPSNGGTFLILTNEVVRSNDGCHEGCICRQGVYACVHICPAGHLPQYNICVNIEGH